VSAAYGNHRGRRPQYRSHQQSSIVPLIADTLALRGVILQRTGQRRYINNVAGRPSKRKPSYRCIGYATIPTGCGASEDLSGFLVSRRHQ